MSSNATHSLILELSETSAQELIEATRNASASHFVEHVVVFTHPDPDFDLTNLPWPRPKNAEEWSRTPDVPDLFRVALQRIVHLPRLKSFELRFTKECAVKPSRSIFAREVPETETYRTAMLARAFNVLDSLVTAGRPIESLAVKNLQNAKIPAITESAEFKTVVANLKQLHLSICTEYDDASPESSIDRPEYMEYPSHLSREWLNPVRDQLTHLSIYWDVFFGAIPTFPGYLPVHFPNLKSLTLGNYAFAYDLQLDWILSHADTLEELVLDENAIVHHIGVYEDKEMQKFRIDTRFLERILTTADGVKLFKYSKHWHDYFDALREGLPHLRRFRFGSNWHAARGSVNPNYLHEFENRYEVNTELFPGRYVVFDSGIGSSQWLGPEEDGSYPDAYSGHEILMTSPDIDFHERDQEALDRLLETVSARDAERSIK